MNTLKQIPDEDVYYNFEDEVSLEYYGDNLIICGNRHFTDFGDSTLLKVANGEYWWNDEEGYGDDEPTEKSLERYTGKKWKSYCMTGYSQGEWQYIYYVEDSISEEELKTIEDFYMNKVKEFISEDYGSCLVPNDVVWKGKEAICNYLGLDAKDTKILKTGKSHTVYDYEEVK